MGIGPRYDELSLLHAIRVVYTKVIIYQRVCGFYLFRRQVPEQVWSKYPHTCCVYGVLSKQVRSNKYPFTLNLLHQINRDSLIPIFTFPMHLVFSSISFDVKWFPENDFYILRCLLLRKIMVNEKYFPFDQNSSLIFKKWFMVGFENCKPFFDFEHLILKLMDPTKTHLGPR